MLDQFFLWDAVPTNAMHGTYTPLLVLASYAIASFGSYTGLNLAAAMRDMKDHKIQNLIHAGGAFVLGSGIWAMHFVGMLSYKMDMDVSYHFGLTALSLLIAIGIACSVFGIVRRGKVSTSTLTLGSLLLGAAICSMHYTGMAAMNMGIELRYRPDLFSLSVLIAVSASAAALWIIFSLEHFHGKTKAVLTALAALIMGAAICGMHYTGMAAAVFMPMPMPEHSLDTTQNTNTLVLSIVAITSSIFVIALMLSAIIKERIAAQAQQDYPFPVKLLILSGLLTVTAITWASGSSLYINHQMVHSIRDNLEISHMGNRIAYLDTVISRALRMDALTADTKWEIAYKENLQLSNKIISDLETATSTESTDSNREATEINAIARRIDRNSDFFLTALEDKVLELARNGKSDEARAFLDGSEYSSRKQDYMDDVATLHEKTADILSHTIESLAVTVFYTLYLGIIVIVILPAAWAFAFRSVRQWRKELERVRRNLEINEKELQRFISEIEISRTEAIKAKERIEKESRTVALLKNVSAAANKMGNQNESIRTVLQLTGVYLDCPIGHAYIIDKENDLLRPTQLWHVGDGESFFDFIQTSDIAPLKRGTGLPGRAWEQKKLIWIEDLSKDPNFQYDQPDTKNRIKAGFAFPLLVAEEVAYVLEFYFAQPRPIDESLPPILQEISHQLANVIEREQAKANLHRAKEMAEKANAAKSDFLANMSHELRTPMNSILGMLQLLKDAKLSGEEREMLEAAARGSTNLLEIVNDILDISKIEAGGMTLESIGLDLKHTLDNVVTLLTPLAQQKSVPLALHIKGGALPYVLGDPTRISRILTNLISNALKYTSRGQVTVWVSHTKFDGNRMELRCEVEDSGIGIAKDKLQSVFEKFVQADTSTTRKYGGTGLGLAITKQLVEMMGGFIGVESELGVGSTFWFTIPFEITDKLEERQTNRITKKEGGIPTPQARILVAEDNQMNQALIQKILKRFGIGTVKIAVNGDEALHNYTTSTWDIILMDCHMPKKNGYDTTIAIRQIETENGGKKRIPIIAMTADAMIGDRDKCLSCGMDEYISKPLIIEELKEILSQWLCFDEPTSTTTAAATTTNEESCLDLSSLKQNVGDDLEAQKDLIRVFIVQADENIKAFLEPLTIEAAQWKETAHLLKGGTAAIGARHLTNLFHNAQHFNGTETQRIELFSSIQSEYARVREQLNKMGFLA